MRIISAVAVLSCFLHSYLLFGQSQQKADSLRRELAQVDEERLRIDLIKVLTNHEQNRDTVLKYSLEYAWLAEKLNLHGELSRAYGDIASAYSQKGQLSKALTYFQLALETSPSEIQKGVQHSNLASVYQNNSDFERARFHYSQGRSIFENQKDQLRLGTTLVSLGYLEYLDRNYDESILVLKEGARIFRDTTIAYNDYYWSYAAGNLALSMARNQELEESERQIDTVIQILNKYQDEYAIADYRTEMARIYFESGEDQKALESALVGAELAQKNEFRKNLRDAHEILSSIYRKRGNLELALESYQIHIANKDSLMNADLIRQLANQRTEFEVGQKQAEVDVLTAEKRTQQVILWSVAGFALILFVLAGIIYKYYRNKARVNKLLTEQKEELERLNSTKDRFFSIISHDLRGPVSAFTGVSRLIKFFVRTKEINGLNEIADEMDKSVDQLSSLLDNLLNWAMQQQGHVSNIPEKLSLYSMASDQVSIFSNMAKSKGINLSCQIDDQIYLWVDRNTTSTIFRNLVNNALKFTPEGGKVTIKGSVKKDMAEIIVSDTGVGIAADKLDKIFELRDKGSSYGTYGEKGLGLGLQLVQEFIEMNDGALRIESAVGRGSAFIVTLPLYDTESVALNPA